MEREYLTGEVILGKHDDGSNKTKFEVKAVIGEGGTAVVYEAIKYTLKSGQWTPDISGILKEFYPVDADDGRHYYALKREGQKLVSRVGSEESFQKGCEEYEEAHELINKKIIKNPEEHKGIINGIQLGEMYYGNNTVYYWYHDVYGLSFSQYLMELRRDASSYTAEKLMEILDIILQLSDCVIGLHKAGLTHMDLKPSNFLVAYNNDGTINPQRISLFDINSIVDINDQPKYMGTRGFMAPQLMQGKRIQGRNKLDIYSLGAILYNALVIEKINDADYVKEGSLYEESCDIEHMLQQSLLMKNSNINSNERLLRRLCKILGNALHMRYEACSVMEKDLRDARKLLNDLIVFTPVIEKDSDLADPTIIMQKLLYEHPLYEALREEKEINILVLADEVYSAYTNRFIDLCMQVGQMKDIRLNINCYMNEADSNREDYLHFRPAMTEFVQVNGEYKYKRDSRRPSYARLTFADPVNGRKFNNEIKNNLRITEDILSGQKHYHYIFIAVGDDAMNYELAQVFAERSSYQVPSCPVRVSKKQEVNEKDIANKIYTVNLSEEIDEDSVNARLGNMAFNVHLSYKGDSNLDVKRERELFFHDPEYVYDKRSSIALALSVKYKLYSIGIRCENLDDAAKLFQENVLDRMNKDEKAAADYRQLVFLEHSRWVLDRIMDGWTAPKDFRGYLDLQLCVERGKVKDNASKTHPCIVHSSEATPLNRESYRKNHRARWDGMDYDEELDDLDRMSVSLHRLFLEKANIIKKGNVLLGNTLRDIQNKIPASSVAINRAFRRYQFAIRHIMDGSESMSKQYGQYQDDLLQTVEKELSPEIYKSIKERTGIIESEIFPVKECNLYRNYKAYDEALITNLPYIMTYQQPKSLAIALEAGKNKQDTLSNVASITVLKPDELHYFYYYDASSDTDRISKKMKAILSYFEKREAPLAIKMFVVCQKGVSCDNLQNQLRVLEKKYHRGNKRGKVWLDLVKYKEADKVSQAEKMFLEYMKEKSIVLYDKDNILFSPEMDSKWMEKIQDKQIASFIFDRRKQTFEECSNCDYLRYVAGRDYVYIEDILALMNVRESSHATIELLDDYENLWEIFGKYGTTVWSRLCQYLQDCSRGDILANMIPVENGHPCTLTCYIPEYTYSTVKNILQSLQNHGIVGRNFSIGYHTSQICKLEMDTCEEYREAFHHMFAQPHCLLDFYQPTVSRDSLNGNVKVTYQNLQVEDCAICTGDVFDEEVYDLLKELELLGYIHNLQRNSAGYGVSFSYISSAMKNLLTCQEEIIKIYAYYEILQTGYFDDLAVDYSFRWESDLYDSDLILTKGFDSLAMTCRFDGEKPYLFLDDFGSFIASKEEMHGQIISTKEELNMIGNVVAEFMKMRYNK